MLRTNKSYGVLTPIKTQADGDEMSTPVQVNHSWKTREEKQTSSVPPGLGNKFVQGIELAGNVKLAVYY